MSDSEIKISKGDIVSHTQSGQTWLVMSVDGNKVRVKGNGRSEVFMLKEVTKAPDRPVREESNIAKR